MKQCEIFIVCLMFVEGIFRNSLYVDNCFFYANSCCVVLKQIPSLLGRYWKICDENFIETYFTGILLDTQIVHF